MSGRTVWALAGLAAVVAAASVTTALVSSGGGAPQSARVRPTPAPTFALPALAQPSLTVTPADIAGRPAVVNFWASWCTPCRREMPAMQSVASELGPGVAFLGIDEQDLRGDGLAFLHRTRVAYPVASDTNGASAKDFGVRGLPTTIFVDSRGRIVGRYGGPLDRATLRRFVDELLLHPRS